MVSGGTGSRIVQDSKNINLLSCWEIASEINFELNGYDFEETIVNAFG